MSEQDNRRDESLVPAGRRDLEPVAGLNHLVSRGLADLAQDRSLDVCEAVRPDPKNARSFIVSGYTWLNQMEYDKAIQDFDEAIRLDPTDSHTFTHRGHAWLGKANYQKALQDYDTAVRLKPKSAIPYFHIAWLLATCPDENIRDGIEAIQLAMKACEITDWKFSWELNVLAAAYAEAGQFGNAKRYQWKALEALCDGGPHENELDEFRQRLELYEQKKPYRLPR